MRNYEFSWDLIGDVEEGRENLGTQVDVDVYRLMQFTLRDVVEQEMGTEKTDKVFFKAGKMAGFALYNHLIAPVETFDEFVSKTQKVLREKRIGILRIEKAEEKEVILTIDEDLDCSGLPVLDYETCIYDEGLVSALFEGFSGKTWNASEVDCWCTGARTCRFQVTMTENINEE